MSREIEIVIDSSGELSIEGFNLKPGERITDVAKFLTDVLAEVTEIGHKHTHSIGEQDKTAMRE